MIPSGIITLTTDFGEKDPYVAIMKGVILAVNPSVRIVDITHQVPAGSIQEGAMIMKDAYKWFPRKTVHLGVIDPGVGGKRRPILVLTENYFFVGPDNGLLWPAIKMENGIKIIHLKEEKYWLPQISSTFHGRDIFAPVAAHLTLGVNPLSLGDKISNMTALDYPVPSKTDNELVGQIMRIDRFGNLITNITERDLRSFLGSTDFKIQVGDLSLKKIDTAYTDVPEGQPLALIGSSNLLELSVNRGNISRYLKRKPEIGTKVIIKKDIRPYIQI